MFVMDLNCKGMKWVENLCLKFEDKFETVCMEVENFMYEEAKCVGTHVQTVGLSAKKLYEEVVQDFIPPLVDNVKETTGYGLSLEKKTDDETSKFSGPVNEEEDPIKKKPSSHEESSILAPAAYDTVQASISSEICIVNHSTSSSDDSCFEIPLEIICYKSVEASDSLASEICKESTKGKGCTFDSSLKQNDVDDKTCDGLIKVPLLSSLKIPKYDPSQESENEISSSAGSSDSGLAFAPFEEKEAEIRLFSFSSNGIDTTTTYRNEDILESDKNGLEQYNECAKFFISPPEPGTLGDNNTEVAELNCAVNTPCTEMIEGNDDTNLWESCIVVDAKELSCVLREVHNRISYKKKIQDAFTSKLRASKQQRYGQLGIYSMGIADEINLEKANSLNLSTCNGQSDSNKLSDDHDLYDSDWELL